MEKLKEKKGVSQKTLSIKARDGDVACECDRRRKTRTLSYVHRPLQVTALPQTRRRQSDLTPSQQPCRLNLPSLQLLQPLPKVIPQQARSTKQITMHAFMQRITTINNVHIGIHILARLNAPCPTHSGQRLCFPRSSLYHMNSISPPPSSSTTTHWIGLWIIEAFGPLRSESPNPASQSYVFQEDFQHTYCLNPLLPSYRRRCRPSTGNDTHNQNNSYNNNIFRMAHSLEVS